LRSGFEALLSAARSTLPFSVRLQNVLALHGDVMEKAKKRIQEIPELRVEGGNIYTCFLFDLLEAMFAGEAEAILHGAGSVEEKRKALQALSDDLRAIPFDDPIWNEEVKPYIQKHLNDALSQIR
jgi:hypothetical protein